MNNEYALIPQITLDSLGRYRNGKAVGGFLTYVLENNLFEAVAYADKDHEAALFQIVKYIYNKLPAACHGSPEKVKDWLSHDSEYYLDSI